MLASNVGPVYGTTLRNLDVHDVNGDPVKSNGGGGGIVWRIEGEKPSRFVDALIEGCHVYDCQRNGIVGKSAYTAARYQRKREYYSQGMRIRQNLVERVPGDGMVILGCDSALVEYNICRDFTDDLPIGDAAAGIWPWNSLNTIIQHNEVSGHKAGWDGQGFDSDWNCEGTVIQYNYSHDNAGGFILICSNGDWGYNDNTIVRYNISINDGYRTWGTGEDFCPTIHIAGNVFNTRIYNNTFFIADKPASVDKKFIESTNWKGWANVTYIHNNLFYATEPHGFKMGSSINNSFRHNFYSTNTSLPADPFPYTGDPLFFSPGTSEDVNDYRISSGSPVINRGILINDNGGKDFYGNEVSEFSAPNIGADNSFYVSVPSLDVNQKEQQLFTIFPNPAAGSPVYLKIPETMKNTRISLVSLTGEILESRSFASLGKGLLPIDLENYRPGMYLVLLESSDYQQSLRLIKR
jgi:hypothetical protein